MLKHLLSALTIATLSLPAFATDVDIITNQGTIKIELNDAASPKSVKNFLRYADEGFYNNTIFHRVMPGFMVQGGGFTPTLERKKTHKNVAYEGENGLYNDRGTIAMARTQDPNSATSQFFINQVDNPFLNHGTRGGFGYTVFGKVISGIEVVDKIARISTKTVGPYQNVPTSTVIIEKVVRSDDL